MTVGLQAVVDSDAFRRFAKRGPGRVVFSSRAYRRANLERHRVIARRGLRRDPAHLEQVRTFCLFVGHTKSGGSMLGGLLDAHPRVAMADEHDALRYVDAGFGRDAVLHLLERGSRAEARKGRVTARRLDPYSFRVPGQHQGGAVAPLVVGDTTAGKTTRRLAADPRALARLAELMGDVDVRFVQVVRNPFDPISVMRVRGRRTVDDAVEHYFAACDALVELRRRVPPEGLLTVRHEDFVGDVRGQLAAVCRFLGVEPVASHLDACASIVGPLERPRFELVEWSQGWIDEVHARIAGVDFLEGYTHED